MILDEDLFIKGTIEWLISQLEYEHQAQEHQQNLLELHYEDLVKDKDVFLEQCNKVSKFTKLRMKVDECWG